MSLHIRSATLEDCDDLGLVIVTATMSALLGRVPEQDIDFSWTPQVSAANWRRDFDQITNSGQPLLVVESDGRVVGLLHAAPQPAGSELEWSVRALYVLPSAQRKGVGRALLSHLAFELSGRGFRSLEIGCVKENPSCGFYQHMGGIEIARRPATVDRYQTVEIVFGWPDITALIDAKALSRST